MNEIKWNPSSFNLPSYGTEPMKMSSNAVDLTMKTSTEYSLDDSLERFVYFTWNIEWKEMKERGRSGIERFSGDCRISYFNGNEYVTLIKCSLEFMNYEGGIIKRRVGKYSQIPKYENYPRLNFSLHLKPLTLPGISKNKLLEKSGNMDGILIIEGQKVRVSKSLLSVHSDYFKALFDSDFKEKNMNEIPIEDVKYGDFILLMDFIWLKSSVLTDDTVEVLLELANRFMMPVVMDRIDCFLMNNCGLEFRRLFYLAEKYNFEKLKKKCIGAIREPIHVKILRNSKYFAGFSQKTKDFLIDKIFELVE